MRKIAFTALCYLLLLAGFVWGLLAERRHIFPYEYMTRAERFMEGGEAEADVKLSPVAKIINDIDLSPHRFIVPAGFDSARLYTDLVLPDARSRRAPLRLYQSGLQAKGYRLIYGPFDLESNIHAAILLDDAGKLVHVWPVKANQSDLNVYPHGIDILPDGSLITSFDSGMILQRINWCGNRMWSRQGDYSHALAYDGKQSVWAVKGNVWETSGSGFEKINVGTGISEKAFSVADIMKANPDIDILSLRQRDRTLDNDPTSNYMEWQHDPWHFNDVEPLGADRASAFPSFSEDDLLISARSLNLLFVLDPDTLAIKWWHVGAARRQHDPDWQKNGTISIFDNRMDWGAVRISALDPDTRAVTILYNGEKDGAYSRIRGKHQVLDNGNILIAVTQQGRVIEVTPKGEIAFELINDFDRAKKQALVISEARFVPPDFFNEGVVRPCAQP